MVGQRAPSRMCGKARFGRRVLVTGIGCVSALGTTFAESLEALRQGCSGLLPFEKFQLPGGLLGAVKPYDARAFFPRSKNYKLASRHTCLAVTAASEALAGATPAEKERVRSRTGVIAGHGAIDNLPDQLGLALEAGYRLGQDRDLKRFSGAIGARLHPLWLLITLPNMVSSQLAIQFDLQGPNSTLLSEWTAGLQALGEAFLLVSQGEADAMLAGASETALETQGVTSRHLEGTADADLRWGEGAAYWLLEASPASEGQESDYWSEVVSYHSWSSEASDPDAWREGIETTLGFAGVRPSQVNRVCPAALRLRGRRERETRVLDELFEDAVRLDHQDRFGFLGTAHPVLEASLAAALGQPGEQVLVLSEGVEGNHCALLLRTGGRNV